MTNSIINSCMCSWMRPCKRSTLTHEHLRHQDWLWDLSPTVCQSWWSCIRGWVTVYVNGLHTNEKCTRSLILKNRNRKLVSRTNFYSCGRPVNTVFHSLTHLHGQINEWRLLFFTSKKYKRSINICPWIGEWLLQTSLSISFSNSISNSIYFYLKKTKERNKSKLELENES